MSIHGIESTTTELSTGSARNVGELPRAFLTALVVPAVAILLHELGHFAAHAAFGYEVNRLTYEGVRSMGAPAGVDATLAEGISTAAGGAVSLLLVLGVWQLFAKRGPTPWILPIAMFESVRGAAYLWRQLDDFGAGYVVRRGFGEIRYAARAFGGLAPAEVALSVVELGVPVAVLLLVLEMRPPGERLIPAAVVVAGLSVGAGLWVSVVGPAVLPA